MCIFESARTCFSRGIKMFSKERKDVFLRKFKDVFSGECEDVYSKSIKMCFRNSVRMCFRLNVRMWFWRVASVIWLKKYKSRKDTRMSHYVLEEIPPVFN